jgi:hypothetical protein
MKWEARKAIAPLLAAVAIAGGLAMPAYAQQAQMSFFITSAGKGDGANLGGLAGADAHCQALAASAGAASPNWRAYLSTTAPGGDAGVNARDRIGNGPWKNAKGVEVAKNVNDLHSASANVTKQTALTEKGEVVSGRGDAVNMHDILTGTDPQGMYSTAGERRRLGDRRPSRSRRTERQPPHELLEFLARLAWMQPGSTQGQRRRWNVLLLPEQLIQARHSSSRAPARPVRGSFLALRRP